MDLFDFTGKCWKLLRRRFHHPQQSVAREEDKTAGQGDVAGGLTAGDAGGVACGRTGP